MPTMNSSNILRFGIFLALLEMGSFLRAQIVPDRTSTLEQEEITVVGSYRPALADAIKVNPAPGIPELPSEPISPLVYTIPLQLQAIPWQAPEVKPVSLGKPTLQPLPNLFAKLGFGTQFSPLVEAAYSSGRSDKFNYGMRGLYTSSNGARENQLYSNAGLSGFGKVFFGPVALGLQGQVESETFHFYGYDEEDTSYARKDVRRRFLETGVIADLSNSRKNELGLDYNIRGGVQTLADQLGTQEIRPQLEGSFRYAINAQDEARLFTGYESMVFSGPYSRSRSVFRFRPTYVMNRYEYSLKAGLEMALDTGRFKLFPDLEFSAKLMDQSMVFFAGWNMRLQTNSWRSLSESNPYLLDSVWFNNSRVEDRYAGIRGEYDKRLGYQLRFSQKPINDFALFVNDSADTRRFDVIYEDITLWVAHAEVSYQWSDNYTFFAGLDLRSFSEIGEQEYAWHEPNVLWNLGARVKATQKLYLKADVLGMGATHARLPDGTAQKLRGTADINLGATYAVNSYFTAWVDVNNMASIKHQRYYLYPSYGFRFMAGLQFSF